MECNRIRFKVLLSNKSPENSIQQEYLRQIESLQESDANGELEKLFDKIANLLAVHYQPWFKQYTIALSETHPSLTLRSYLDPNSPLAADYRGWKPTICCRELKWSRQYNQTMFQKSTLTDQQDAQGS